MACHLPVLDCRFMCLLAAPAADALTPHCRPRPIVRLYASAVINPCGQRDYATMLDPCDDVARHATTIIYKTNILLLHAAPHSSPRVTPHIPPSVLRRPCRALPFFIFPIPIHKADCIAFVRVETRHGAPEPKERWTSTVDGITCLEAGEKLYPLRPW